MYRPWLFMLLAGGLAFGLYASKPSTSDFHRELEARSSTVWGHDSTVSRVLGSHPLDEMVIILSPEDAVRRTILKDFYIVTLFETTYEAVGVHRRIRTIGLGSSFFVIPNRQFVLNEHLAEEPGEALTLW